MKLTPQKTERGWELADETGTFESEETSLVFRTKAEAQAAALQAIPDRHHDESKSAIFGDNF